MPVANRSRWITGVYVIRNKLNGIVANIEQHEPRKEAPEQTTT